MKKIKEIFLRQLSDAFNKKASDNLLNKQRENEIIEETTTEAIILAKQKKQIEHGFDENQNDNFLVEKNSEPSKAREKSDLIVGE